MSPPAPPKKKRKPKKKPAAAKPPAPPPTPTGLTARREQLTAQRAKMDAEARALDKLETALRSAGDVFKLHPALRAVWEAELAGAAPVAKQKGHSPAAIQAAVEMLQEWQQDVLDKAVEDGLVEVDERHREEGQVYLTRGELDTIRAIMSVGSYGKRKLPPPTDTPPGSAARVGVMGERRENGEELRHPKDATPDGKRGLRVTARKGGAGEVGPDGKREAPPPVVEGWAEEGGSAETKER